MSREIEFANMTQDEINRKISQLRNEWAFVTKTGQACNNFPINWHADANWPTLLREILVRNSEITLITFSYWSDSSYLTIKKQTPFSIFTDHCESNQRVERRTDASDIGEAVCLAWLKWKEEAK